ncbi:transcriptional regulator, TetR family [Lachnospiraceae bacterium KM106-2]|nr:transcriptional regulator, TetR family [Lachnospiraceae bacterium KM106-2]
MTTKERIILESMKLFSVKGFDAVSIRAIAEAVGVGNSALYKHFKSKQAIFDAIVEQSKLRFQQQMESQKEIMKSSTMSVTDLKELCIHMFEFQVQDDWIVMFRRMLLLEHYKNPQMAQIYMEFFIESPIQIQKKIFTSLIEEGIMKDRNAEVMAMELYAPFFLYHTVGKKDENQKELFMQHVNNFYEAFILEE